MSTYKDWSYGELELVVTDPLSGAASFRIELPRADGVNLALTVRVGPKDLPGLIAELQVIDRRNRRQAAKQAKAQ